MKTEDGIEIELIELVDLIDDCNWGIWLCNCHFPDGRYLENCEIQTDGYLCSRESLVDDNGNKI